MTYFSENIAKQAAEAVRVQADQMIRPKGTENGFSPNGGGLHIIVGTSKGKILAVASVGEPENWSGPYDKIAESKFNLTVETGMPTRKGQLLYPELMEGAGNTYYWGSWIDGGIVVACSGVDPEWDEAFSKMGCGFVRAMVTKKQQGEVSSGKHFRD